MRDPAVFVVIPAYNESAVVGDVVQHVRAAFSNVVVVDDGSRDATGAIARAHGAEVVTHLVNRGQGASLRTGIERALVRGADIIITFDSDGQHRVDDIHALAAPVAEGRVDVALGSRFLGGHVRMPFTRRLLLKLGVMFTRVISHVSITDTHNGLRAFSRRAAAAIEIHQDRMAHASEILDEISRLKLSYCEVPVTIVYTDYSRLKGQRSPDAIRIAWDLFVSRVRR